MTQGILAATVLEVGPVMAKALGLDWCRDRKEVVEYINKFRRYLSLMYQNLALFTDKFYCLEVSRFPADCGNVCDCCGNFYHGITIPGDIDGVLAVWEDHKPMRLYSKWWEAREGIVTNESCPRMAAVLMAETFATERPLQKPSALHFYASSTEDEGKRVVVKASTKRHRNKEFHVLLMGDGIAKIREKIHTIHSIVLPPHLCGTVSLMQADGYELSEYSGYQTVPTFRRMKIMTPCPSGRVLLQGSLKYTPVYFDPDIVEVGDPLIVESAGWMFRYESSTDAGENQKAQMEAAKIKKYITNAIARQRGRAIQEPGRFSVKLGKIARGLPGYEAR